MEKKNPMDPITPPADGVNSNIFNNQTPEPHVDQGDPRAFVSPTKNFDDITAKILEEAPPMPEQSTINQTLPETPVLESQNMPKPVEPAPFTQGGLPQEQPAMMPEMPDTNVHMGGAGNKFMNWKVATIAVIGIIVLTIGGVSAFKGDFYWIRDLVGMGIPSDPTKAIQKANTNMNKLDNVKENLNLELSGNFDNKDLKILMDMDASTKKDTAHIKLNSLELTLPKDLTGPVDTSKINEAIAGLEVISDKDAGYIKVPSVDDTWYKVDKASLENFQDINNLVPAVFSQETNDDATNPLTAAVAYAAESSQNQSELTKYIKNIKKLKDEKINGKSSYHYQGELDIAKAMESTGGASSAELGSFADKYLKTKVDMYITKKEILFSKISISMDFKMDLSEFGGVGSYTIVMKMNMGMKDYNKGVTIDIPTDAKEIKADVLNAFMSGFTSGLNEGYDPKSTQKANNARRASDAKTLETALESYYVDNNSYLIETSNSKDASFMKDLVPNYLAVMPKDPLHPTYYYSYTSADGKNYTLTYVEESDSGITVRKITK